MKIDLSKAYDIVDWDFVEDLLRHLCFPSRFIRWTMTCLRGTSYHLLLNGRIQGSFKVKRALGFILCPSLSFAMTQDYQLILQSPTHIYFGGVCEEVKEKILEIVQIEEGSFPLKYLGVNLRPTKWKAADCGVILDKLNKNLNCWASRNLSFAGGLLMGEWINSIYLKDQNIWDWPKKEDISWYFKKILSLRDSLDETTLRQATRGNKFSAKRCYNLFVEESQAVNAGAIWDKLVVPKHRFIYWQIFNTHLLTRDYLQQILVIPSNLCPVCDSALETHDHLFFTCSYAIQVFAAVNKWMGNFQWPRSIEEMVRGCCNLKKNLTDRIINTVLAAALYFLWKSRNKCIFDLSCLTPSCLSLGIKDTVRWRLISKGPFKDCKRNKDAGCVLDGYESAYALVASSQAIGDDWILDLSCSFHMTPNKHFFCSFQEQDSGPFLLGDNKACKIAGIGSVLIKMHNGSERTIRDVRYVLNLKRNSLYIGALTLKGRNIKIDSLLRVLKDSTVVMKGNLRNGIYYLVGTTVIGRAATSVKMKQ
uniref:Reverse transcriptase zinc-binding domain-containing protein n=1 Tax=Cannabis sativa TaxID=3483 RepID=A0A803PAJ1_CANSA